MTRRIVDKHIEDRGGTLHVRFKDGDGRWRWKTTGLPSNRLEDARRVRDVLQARAATSVAPDAPLTISLYAERWFEQRRADDIASVMDDESRIRKHFLPRFGALELRELKPHQVKGWVAEMKLGTLAPKTVVNIYSAAARMFSDAEGDGLVERTPFDRRRDRLPRKRDANPEWRNEAVFKLAEVERIITPHAGVPEDRRMFYALMFLCGTRFGEVAALRWRHINTEPRPLQRLTVARSYNTKLRREKTTKTDRVREVPIHPLLQTLLNEWRLDGWRRFFGRIPTDDDLIVPSRNGKNRNANHMLRKFHKDLGKLELRERRQHDARHTFWSLCLDAGANKSRLEWVLWGRPEGVRGAYDHADWESVCAEVAKLKITLRTGQVIELPKAAVAAGRTGDGESLSHLLSQPQRVIAKSAVFTTSGMAGRTGLEDEPEARPEQPFGDSARNVSRTYSDGLAAETPAVAPSDPAAATFATSSSRRPYEPPRLETFDTMDLVVEALRARKARS